MPDESTAIDSTLSSLVLPNTANALSSDDHAPTGDPDTHTSVDAANNTAETTRILKVVRRIPPLMRTTLDGPHPRLPFQPQSGSLRLGSDRHSQAAYRPRDIAKHRETTRTSDQPKLQATARFGTFVQVRGLGLIDLGDRRSGVQISPARPPGVLSVVAGCCPLGVVS